MLSTTITYRVKATSILTGKIQETSIENDWRAVKDWALEALASWADEVEAFYQDLYQGKLYWRPAGSWTPHCMEPECSRPTIHHEPGSHTCSAHALLLPSHIRAREEARDRGELVAELERVRAESERLRQALQAIADYDTSTCRSYAGYPTCSHDACAETVWKSDRAQAALAAPDL